ncbi:MAG: hypothetical protein V1802_00595 [Candidatus Aenigmatarchaeota archaeon]
MTRKIIVEHLVDWGKSFVDLDGNFYSGTTEKQKNTAADVIRYGNMWIFSSDVHSRTSSEFSVNGGMYPVHNLVRKDWYNLDELGVAEEKTVSPELTLKLQEVVKDKRVGLSVSRHVFFQDYDTESQSRHNIRPCFSYKDVEETFGALKLNQQEFLDGAVPYVINAKHMFNGAAVKSTKWMRNFDYIPSGDENVFTLLQQKYGLGKNLAINHTGVVMGICIYQSASGVKQMFPKAEVNIIADGATHLLIPTLGFCDEKNADDVIRSMCQQIGVNYIRSHEYLGRYEK